VSGLQLLKTDGFEITDITSVVVVHLIFCFVAGNFHFVSIDDDDVVACVHMRCVSHFVLTTQPMSGGCGNIAKRLAFCVYNEPFSFYFGR